MIINFSPFRRNLIWYFLVIFSWLPCLAYTIGLMSLVTIGIYGTIIFLSLYYIVQIIGKMKISIRSFIYLILIVFFIIFVFMKHEYMMEDGIRDSIYLVLILLTFSLVYHVELTQEQFHILYNIPFLLNIIMLIFAVLPSSYDLNDYKNALYLNFQNPNILSFVLLIMIIFNLLGFLDEGRKRYLLGIGISILLLLLTHSRGSLLGVFIVFIFWFWKKYHCRVGIWLSVVTTLMPILIVLLTLIFGEINFSIFGKSGSSGRDGIWIYALENIISNKKFTLFGIGTYVNDPTNVIFGNCHNAYMQFACNFGVIATIVVIICLLILSISASKMISNKYGFVAFGGIAGIMLNNSFETHIADGIIGMTFMWIILYWMIISKGEKNDNNSAWTESSSIINKI